MSKPNKDPLEKLKLANAQSFEAGKRVRVDTGFSPAAVGYTLAQFVKLSAALRLALFNRWLAEKLASRGARNV